MDFIAYLQSKRIDSKKFKEVENQKFGEWNLIFEQTGEVSFTQQKLFLINDMRRKYKLDKPKEVIENSHNSDIATNKAELSAKPLGFKPKFK